ncbi:hypothetical protein N8H71_16185 [Pseudomonas koreensis]|uniref:hypothetical protein n=1 Tax=Pseudomonas koreensis TaxID=198620 RepID=UPI0021C95BB0|nr:hypothetical protein [Pseudomonas koreensis]MCU0073132.1 hypothetical protein [Pseudomonas koreensis]
MDISTALKNAKGSGSFGVRLSNGEGFDAVLVNNVPTADGGGILLGVNGTSNVLLNHPKLAAGTHTVTFGNGDARTSINGVSYVAQSGEMDLTVDDPLTTAKGTYRFTTLDGINVEGEFDINAV